MRSKWLSLMSVVLVLIVSIAACGPSATEAPPAAEPTEAPAAEEPTEEPAEEEAEEPAGETVEIRWFIGLGAGGNPEEIEVETAFVDIGDKRNGLRKVDMYGFVVRYFLIEGIRVLHRAIFHTCRAAGALVLQDVARLFGQGDREIPGLPFHAVNFRECQNLYVWMPADLDQFR